MNADILAQLPGNTHHAAAAPRLDLYAGIHKALREFMGDTLGRVGRVDVDDADDWRRTLAQVEALLAELRHHVHNENNFVHTAIEARRPAGSARTAGDHVEHLVAIADLEDELRALRAAAPDRRGALVQRLYRHLAGFVAENLEHMQVEETMNNAVLWSLYTDAELAAIHGANMATIGPDEMATVMRWMSRALSPQELAALLLEARGGLPSEAFAGLLEIARVELDAGRFAKLALALGVAPVPGLVETA